MDSLLQEPGLRDLPRAALANATVPYDPPAKWISRAKPENQTLAMRCWFRARYCDPAELGLYYDKEEGGYAFPSGRSYDAREVLEERFDGHVGEALIQRLAFELEMEGGIYWASRTAYLEEERDAYFELHIESWEMPLELLKKRLDEALQVSVMDGHSDTQALARNLVFGALISALEAFLWETADYWVAVNAEALRDVVTKLQVFNDDKRSLAELFTLGMDGIKSHVRSHFQKNVLWHQVKTVSQIFRVGLGVQLSSWNFFTDALDKRHHIVHRSGHDHERNPVEVSAAELEKLSADIQTFAEHIHKQLCERAQAAQREEVSQMFSVINGSERS